MTLKGMCLAVPLCLLLVGCDADEISIVKSSSDYRIDDTLTLGTALETRKDCEKGQWSSSKDDRGRMTVKYSCNLPERYLTYYHSSTEAVAKSTIDERISPLRVHNQLIEEGVVQARQLVQRRVAVIKKNAALINTVAKSYHQNGLSRMGTAYGIFDNPTYIYGSGVTALATVEEFCHASWRGLDVTDPCVTDVYPVYTALHEGLKNLETSDDHYFMLQVIRQCVFAEGESPDRAAQWLAEYAQSAEQAYAASQADIDKNQNRITALEQALQDFKAGLDVRSVTETFYWYVLQEGTVKPLQGEIRVNHQGVEKTMVMRDMQTYLRLAYQNISTTDMPELYISTLNNAIGFSTALATLQNMR